VSADLTLSKGRFAPVAGPVVVVVMDGVGLGPADEGNAVHLARTPVLDALTAANHGGVPLAAHGLAVGLPSDEDMGNSEVGHNALGAGRVFAQGAKLVNAALETGSLFRGPTWQWLVEGVRESGEPLHFLGLLSDGNVHSHEQHLHALLRHAHADGVKRVRVHMLTDGRDVGGTTALLYVDRLEAVLAEINANPERDYRIASGGGRMFITMDRYNAEWPMVERGWAIHVRGEGRRFASAREAISTLRDETPGVSDQNLPGFVIAGPDGGPTGPIRDGASVCLFNFRGDRAIEITRAFEETTLDAFDRGEVPRVRYAGMMQYDGDLKLPARFLVEPPAIDRTLSEYLVHNGVTQLACSETQKFGHVTYFWNGNRSGYLDERREKYVEIPSDVISFDQRPWMKAAEITDAVLTELRTGRWRHARLNYANGDMVGHTGDREAAVTAVQVVDLCLGRLLSGLAAMGGVALVTADHGNADEMYERDKKGQFARDAVGGIKPKTSHSLNAVPCLLYDPRGQVPAGLAAPATGGKPGLAHVASTVCELVGLAPPADYAPSLLAPR
jgi:2,3-bisphosphoglycerate-independent phosphoglycerate mutase